MNQLTFVFLIFGAVFVSASSICSSPEIASKVYTTSDAQISSDTVIVVEFDLKCSNDAIDINLHAEFNGKTFPVTLMPTPNRYQISISDEHKKLLKGSYQVRLFDDESYNKLRKAQRSGEESDSVQGLATIEISHKGTSRGPWIHTEHIALAGSMLVLYIAHSLKSCLQN